MSTSHIGETVDLVIRSNEPAEMLEQYDRVPADAEAFMAEQHEHIITPDYSVGWGQRDKETDDPNRPNEDSVYALYDENEERLTVGVFDGVGGHADGALASHTARQIMHEIARDDLGTTMKEPVERLTYSLDRAAEAVKDISHGDGYDSPATTALLAVVQRDKKNGEMYIHTAAVGDSLGYIVRKDGTIIDLNKEETMARLRADLGKPVENHHYSIITNAVGSFYEGVTETSSERVSDGDVIILTSDGITGDSPKQAMRGGDNAAAMREVAHNADVTPQEKAQLLIELARKNDDRTAIVIEVAEKNHARVQQKVARAAFQTTIS